MFGFPVRITWWWETKGWHRFRDHEGTAYGVRKADLSGQLVGTLMKVAKDSQRLVSIDSHPTAFGFRYVRDINWVTDKQEVA